MKEMSFSILMLISIQGCLLLRYSVSNAQPWLVETQDCFHKGFYRNCEGECVDAIYNTDENENWLCNDACQPITVPCNNSCIDFYYNDCSGSCFSLFTFDAIDLPPQWLCNDTCQPLSDPCHGYCVGYLQKCQGKCIERSLPCNGECRPSQYLSCDGLCIDRSRRVEEHPNQWLCDGICQDSTQACNGQCPRGNINCNGTCDPDLQTHYRCGDVCQSIKIPCNGSCQHVSWTDRIDFLHGWVCYKENICLTKSTIEECSIEYRSWEPLQSSPWFTRNGESNDLFLCQKTEQIIQSSSVCNNIIDCIDRTDESNCLQPTSVPFKDVFQDCIINNETNYLRHSVEGSVGFRCGKSYCIEIDLWCNVHGRFNKTFIEGLLLICPDLIMQVNSQLLCSNQTFWRHRPCRYMGSRCRGNYPGQCIPSVISSKPFCQDKSDYIMNASLEIPNFEKCKLTDMSIQSELFCDGIPQCEDSSDEDPVLCRQCPKQKGYPPVKSQFATLSCHHRYTKRPICAVPCDGIDDLCENFEDEQCSVNSALVSAVLISVLLLAAIIVGELVNYFDSMKALSEEETRVFCDKLWTLFQCPSESFEPSDFATFHDVNGYDKHLVELLAHNKNIGYDDVVMRLVQQEQLYHGNAQNAALCFKNNLGDSEYTQKFVKSLKINNKDKRRHARCYVFTFFNEIIKRFLEKDLIVKLKGWVISMVKILFYYMDIIKDVILLTIMFKITNLSTSYTSFEMQILLWTCISIAFPQILIFCHMVYLTLAKQVNACIGTLLSVLFFIIPAASLYQIGKLTYMLKNKFQLGVQIKKLTWMKRCSYYKMVESKCENSIQVIILILVVLLKNSETKLYFGLENLISDAQTPIVALSALWSLISMVMTEINWQDSLKNYSISLKGKLTIAIFFLLSVLSRCLAIIFYFTPTLGIFNTMGHWAIGKLKINLLMVPQVNEDSMEINFDFFEPLQLKFKGKYEANQSIPSHKMEDYSEMAGFSLQTYFLIFVCLFLFHLMSVFLVNFCFSLAFKCKKDFASKTFHVWIQLFNPSVYRDWDSDISSVAEAKLKYEKVKKEMKALLILFFVENVLMCVPIWILTFNIFERNKFLDEYLHQLDEEILSTRVSLTLSVVAPIIFVVLPMVQYWIFILYNRHCHPWCILLRENSTEVSHDLPEEIEMETLVARDPDLCTKEPADGSDLSQTGEQIENEPTTDDLQEVSQSLNEQYEEVEVLRCANTNRTESAGEQDTL